MTTLNQYEFQVADVLHDPSQLIWSLSQLDFYINQARIKVAQDTGCLRLLQSSYLTQGTEAYTFGAVGGGVVLTSGSGYTSPSINWLNPASGGIGVAGTLTQSGGAVNAFTLTNPGSGYSNAPVASVVDGGPGVGATVKVGVTSVNTYDILTISVYWGQERYALLWRPFSVLSTQLRLWQSAAYQQRPAMWAVYGETGFYVAPVPDQSYAIELDTVVLPVSLTDYTTPDPIPIKYQEPIRFYAGHLAKYNQQAYGESEMLLAQYRAKIGECTGSYVRRIPDPYEV